MIVATIQTDVRPEKRIELLSTIEVLRRLIFAENGCLSCSFLNETGDINSLRLISEWASKNDLKAHIRSANFGVLLGMAPLLRKPIKIHFDTVYHREKNDLVQRIRNGTIYIEEERKLSAP